MLRGFGTADKYIQVEDGDALPPLPLPYLCIDD